MNARKSQGQGVQANPKHAVRDRNVDFVMGIIHASPLALRELFRGAGTRKRKDSKGRFNSVQLLNRFVSEADRR